MLSLVLKATERCNSRCVYCHERPPEPRTIDRQTLAALFARIGELLHERPAQTVEVLWHGGEPLLLGAERFRQVAQMQKRTCGTAIARLRHSVQTNALCLDEELLDALVALGVDAVGTSFDPMPHVRGLGREIDSARYNRGFLDGVSLLDRYGIRWGVLHVVTRRSLERPLDVLQTLVNINPPGAVSFNPVLGSRWREHALGITPAEFVDFLGAIFEPWWRHRSRFPDVEPFSSIVREITDSGAANGTSSALARELLVRPDGEAFSTRIGVGGVMLRVGDIGAEPLGTLFDRATRTHAERQEAAAARSRCRSCRLWSLCRGGCAMDAFASYEAVTSESQWCDARRRFITEVVEPTIGATVGSSRRPAHA